MPRGAQAMRFTFLKYPQSFGILSALFFLIPSSALAQARARKTIPTTVAAPGSIGEQRAARALESVRQNPLELRDFLVRLPKGGALLSLLLGGGLRKACFPCV